MTKTDRVPYGIAPWETGGVSASPDLGSNQTTQASVALPIDALPRGDEHILVVEDDPRVRSGVLEQLRSLGYEATARAMARLAWRHSKPRRRRSICC